ncbi:MAG: T9SS type A sorting domain-containing protein [Bacteroides sp.]|nr:T9SS type A sorting domain-containing protein [Bacteroides sp.]
MEGDVTSLTVSDMAGKTVFSAVPVSDTVVTGLPGGLYLVRAVTASGATIVCKTAF